MTRALEEALKEASKLSESEQNSLAAAIRDELEAKWERSLSDSQDVLGRLADEALDEFRSSRTQLLDVKKK